MKLLRPLWTCATMLLASVTASMCAGAHANAADYQIEVITDQLEYPWAMAWLPDGRLLITERVGRLRVYENGALHAQPIAGTPPVHFAGQAGLFDVLPDPDFARNHRLYLSHAAGTAKSNTLQVSAGRLSGDHIVDVQPLFIARPMRNTSAHYGGRMSFLDDGTLVVGLGDGFDFREQAQRLDNHFGKIVRIRTDGSIPSDNPFVDDPRALPEIYTYGHRNVQGLVFDPATGRLWSNEHGPRGGDELNLILAGQNYGWPIATHGIDYSGARISPHTSLPGLIDPIVVWSPSIAPASLAICNGGLFPEWRGRLMIAALAARRAQLVDLEQTRPIGQMTILDERGWRLRDIESGPDGAIWVLTDGAPGRLLRLTPVAR
ncbi:MAG: PQQ-dependent sugar dehydrogenase [Wenzhouxiangellaceae bacterium]